jgi:hypothetical protein
MILEEKIPMKSFLFWLLFAASGAFNVFFVAGMVMMHRGPPGPPGPEDRAAFLARRLDLDEAQQSALLELEWKAEEEKDRIASEQDARFAKLIDELTKEEPREEILKEFIESGSASARDQYFVDYIRAVMKILRPEQRGKAAEWFRKGPGVQGRRRPNGPPFDGPWGKDVPRPR